MKVAIIQSSFIPWRGYFDFIDDVDLFIYYDDIQYSKNSWRNRNRIKTLTGPAWVTVPVHVKKLSQLISKTKIDYSQKWADKIINRMKNNYSGAPYVDSYLDEFTSLLKVEYASISELNVAVNAWILCKLGIETEIKMSSEFDSTGTRTARLIDILKKTGAGLYLSGPSAKEYLEMEKFREAGIAVEFKSYSYQEYPQLHGAFEPNVTILDLLFNCGPDAKRYLKSTEKNEKVL